MKKKRKIKICLDYIFLIVALAPVVFSVLPFCLKEVIERKEILKNLKLNYL